MVALGNTLVVITQDGNVFGSDVAGHTLSPVYQFSGPKIGYNPQDRFMVADSQAANLTLFVITHAGDVFGSDMTAAKSLGPIFQANLPAPPHLVEISRVDGTPWSILATTRAVIPGRATSSGATPSMGPLITDTNGFRF
jgi:hypothetical protein